MRLTPEIEKRARETLCTIENCNDPECLTARQFVGEIDVLRSRVKELEEELAKEKEWSQNHVDDACGVQEENSRLRKVVEAAMEAERVMMMQEVPAEEWESVLWQLQHSLRELDGEKK